MYYYSVANIKKGEEMSWKEDLKEACREFGIDDGYRVEIEDFISYRLKKQREICAKIYRETPEECWECMSEKIKNAPEDE